MRDLRCRLIAGFGCPPRWAGSRIRLIAALLREGDWTDEQLEELRRLVRQATMDRGEI
jgi:hypothetical protein